MGAPTGAQEGDGMRISSKLIAGAAALAVVATHAGTALAGAAVDVPAPGILGLVAMGVIAAIAIARHRK